MRMPAKDLTLVLIITVAIIDAVLLGIFRAEFIKTNGYDVRPRHLAVPKPAPP
jgi:hypothetical protein